MKVKLKRKPEGPTFKVVKFVVGPKPGISDRWVMAILLNEESGDFITASYEEIIAVKKKKKKKFDKKIVETSKETTVGY